MSEPNGKIPSEPSQVTDSTKFLTALELLTNGQKNWENALVSLVEKLEKTDETLQLLVEKEKHSSQTIVTLIERQKTLETTLQTLIGKQTTEQENFDNLKSVLEALIARIERLENRQDKAWEQSQRSLEKKFNNLPESSRGIQKTLNSDRYGVLSWHIEAIVLKPIELLKGTWTILLFMSLVIWGLNRIFPPNGRLLQEIKGRVNNNEIRLNRIEKKLGT